DRPWQRDERQRDGENRQQNDFRPRDDRGQGEFRAREDRGRDDRSRDDRPRDDRARDDRGRDDRQRDDRQGRYQRDDRRYQNGGRQGGDARPREDRGDRPERDPLTVIEPQATPLAAQPGSPAPYETHEAGVLRGEDGATSHAPAFLQPRPEARVEQRPEDEAAEPRRPRRRRAPRTFEPGEAAPAPAEADEG
ncbi:MAG: DUF4167 domain-containing protein, partial [Caulobacteraceae bacterium]